MLLLEHLDGKFDEAVLDVGLKLGSLLLLLMVRFPGVLEALLVAVHFVVANFHDQLHVVVHYHLQEVGSRVLLGCARCNH